MNIADPYLLTGIVGLAAFSMLLAAPVVRARLIGNSNLRNALVPLVTAAFLWILAAGGDLLKSRIEESTVPADVVYLHVQNIEFGFPKIPTDYLEHDFSNRDLKKALAPLNADDSNVDLSEEEQDQLNTIAGQSGMVDQVHKGTVYTTKDIASLISDSLYYTYDYFDWSKTAVAWANMIDAFRDNPDKSQNLHKLMEALHSQPTSAGLFQSIIGMSTRGAIVMPDVKGDCDATANGLASVEENDGGIYLVFRTFRSRLANTSDLMSRKQTTNQFGHLLQYSCFNSLSKLFRNASNMFQSEAETMKKYVEAWNRILASKQSETIRVRVALSNLGRFDSFVRSTAKVSVGPVGTSDPITFRLSRLSLKSEKPDVEDDRAESIDDFIEVKSRSNVSVNFFARLTKDLQSKLFGAYQSEQAYLRLGVLASAGASEALVFSQTSPFSSKAKSAFDRMIDTAVIPLQQ